MIVRVAALTQAGTFGRTAAGNREQMARALESLRGERLDLICLPEAFTARGVPADSVAAVAEPIPGPSTERMGQLARELGSHLVCPVYTHREGRYWNSAVVLDREGQVRFIYDKAWPTPTSADMAELELGVSPGSGPCTVDLDIGRLGLQICMDVHFDDGWASLAREGARLVAWPSAWAGGVQLRALAARHGLHVVCGVRSGPARVVDPCGRIAAEGTGPGSAVIAEVNLERLVVREEALERVRAGLASRWGGRVRWSHCREEALVLVECDEGGPPIEEVQAELGLETVAQVAARQRRAIEGRLRG